MGKLISTGDVGAVGDTDDSSRSIDGCFMWPAATVDDIATLGEAWLSFDPSIDDDRLDTLEWEA